MKNLKNDILISLVFLSGIWGFISGEFIFSTILFAAAALMSNILIRSNTKI